MKKVFSLVLFLSIVSIVVFIAAASSVASGHGDARPVKKGILLAAFGTSYPQALAAYENIEEKTRIAFPDIPVRWAFTSHIIRNKLAREGQDLKSPARALADMAEENFTHVVVQSLHTIPGEEYDDLKATTEAFAGLPGGFEKIALGHPLLAGREDMSRVASAIMATLPEKREPADAVLLMGHGSPHWSDVSYAALMWRLQLTDPNIYVATVDGFPEIAEISDLLKKKNVRKVWLAPFMSVAGDHARNDMAGPESDSWKSVLTAEGMVCETILKGTAEYDAFVEIWIDHMRDALKTF